MSQVIKFGTSGVIPPGTYVETLTGDQGGAVNPDGAGNINVITDNAALGAGSSVLFVGTPINNTLTLVVTDVNNNTIMGADAGNLTLSGSSNTGLGYANLATLTTGSRNTAVGRSSLSLLTDGSDNTAIGYQALALCTGTNNTVIGANAGDALTLGNENVALGTDALGAATLALQNTAIGTNSMRFLTTGIQNVAVGQNSLFLNTTGSNNTCVGLSSLSQATGSGNVAFGGGSLSRLTTGQWNAVLGNIVADNLVTGNYNIAIGSLNPSGTIGGAGRAWTSSESSNIAIGNNGVAAENNTIRIGTNGSGNAQQNRCFVAGINGVTVANPKPVVIDTVTSQLGVDNGTGSVLTLTGDVGPAVSPTANNINVISGLLTNNAGGTVFFEGSGSTLTLEMSHTVLGNTFIGSNTGNTTTTGSNNTVVGIDSLAGVTTGSLNTAFGYQNLTSVTVSSQNSAFGYRAARLVTAAGNTAIGYNALRSATNTAQNTAIGFESLNLYTLPGDGTGNNVAVGASTLAALLTGKNNVALGTPGASGSFLGYLGAESNNILISNNGVTGDSGVIRIGTPNTQTTAYFAGINGNTVANTRIVTIDSSTSQLGTTALSPSSLFPWSVITTSQTAAVNNGYFINSVGSMNLALPAASAVGDVIEAIVVSNGSTLNITQAAGQQIFFGNTNTTLGAGGSLQSTSIGDAIKLVCRTANTVWYVVSSIGNFNVI